MIHTTKTNILTGANYGVANGINICRHAVDITLGGKGKKVTIKQEFYPYYLRTKDAFSIIQAIKCEDPLEALAVDMMKDATDSMNKRSKDGRTTMTILADEILQGVQSCQDKTIDWEKELTDLIPFVEQEIDKQTKQITVDEVESVARTASDSERLGKLIGDVYKKQGAECIINHIESSGTFDDEVEYTNGVHFTNTGFVAPAFVHDEQAVKEGRREVKAIYENPTILVTKNKINEIDIDPLLSKLVQQGKKDLIIFAHDMDNEMVRKLIATHQAKILNICVVKAPIVYHDLVFEAFAKSVGATIIEDATGKTFKNMTFDDLGTCSRIEIEKEEIVLNPSVDLSDYKAELKEKGDDDSLRKLFWLNTKTAKIKLGAINEGELSLLRLKATDAVHSSQLALQYGVVKGAGQCLASIELPNTNFGSIMKQVLEAPRKQIIKNMNTEIVEENIVDASAVVKNAFKNAVGVALGAIDTPIYLDLPKRTAEDLQLEILGRQRMNF